MRPATTYGPSGSSTWRVPDGRRLFSSRGEAPTARPYHGLSPSSSWSADYVEAHGERRSAALANEAGGPVAQLLPVPQDGGDGGGRQTRWPGSRRDIADAKGQRAACSKPRRADGAEGLQSQHPALTGNNRGWDRCHRKAMVKLADSAFSRVLAAAGVPPSLVCTITPTAPRSARDLRRYHMGVPLYRMAKAFGGRAVREIRYQLSRSHSIDYPMRYGVEGASVCEARGGRGTCRQNSRLSCPGWSRMANPALRQRGQDVLIVNFDAPRRRSKAPCGISRRRPARRICRSETSGRFVGSTIPVTGSKSSLWNTSRPAASGCTDE